MKRRSSLLVTLLLSLSLFNVIPSVMAQEKEGTSTEQPKEEPTEDDFDYTIDLEPFLPGDGTPDSIFIEDPDAGGPPNPLSWRVELRNQLEFLSNVDQLQTSQGDGVNRAILSGALRYTFPTNTQILVRPQFFFFKYFSVKDRDQIVGSFSLNLSQWFFNRLNVYVGWLPILLSSVCSQKSVSRFDHDFLGGLTFYHLFSREDLLFTGYQADYLLAEVAESRNLGHTLLAGYRREITPDLFLFADVRGQFRGFKSFVDEMRFGLGATLQWHVFRPWFIIETRADFTQVVNITTPEKNVSLFTLGFNLVGGVQSK